MVESKKQALNNLIKTIRESFPKNAFERIAYIEDVNACIDLINELQRDDPDYMIPILRAHYNDYKEIIIGDEYLKQVSKKTAGVARNTFGNKCAICEFPLSEVLDIHHIIPKYFCGKNDPTNLIALCPNCHKIFHRIERTGEINNEINNYLNNQKIGDKVKQYTEHLLCFKDD